MVQVPSSRAKPSSASTTPSPLASTQGTVKVISVSSSATNPVSAAVVVKAFLAERVTLSFLKG